MKLIAIAALLAASALAWSEGPGSRLRTTPEVPPPPTSTAPASPSQQADERCNRMSGARRERCQLELRAAAAGRAPAGPESTGMGSGAGSGVSGTTGGASAGGSAPR